MSAPLASRYACLFIPSLRLIDFWGPLYCGSRLSGRLYGPTVYEYLTGKGVGLGPTWGWFCALIGQISCDFSFVTVFRIHTQPSILCYHLRWLAVSTTATPPVDCSTTNIIGILFEFYIFLHFLRAWHCMHPSGCVCLLLSFWSFVNSCWMHNHLTKPCNVHNDRRANFMRATVCALQ